MTRGDPVLSFARTNQSEGASHALDITFVIALAQSTPEVGGGKGFPSRSYRANCAQTSLPRCIRQFVNNLFLEIPMVGQGRFVAKIVREQSDY